MSAAVELSREVGVAPACASLGVARATFYRRRQPPQRKAKEALSGF